MVIQLILSIMVAGGLPYVFAGITKAGTYNRRANERPREWLSELKGWRQRANGVQKNSFEAFPLFAAAVLSVCVTGANVEQAGILAWSFIGIRVVYGVCYIADWGLLRSLVWSTSLAVNIWVFVLAIQA